MESHQIARLFSCSNTSNPVNVIDAELEIPEKLRYRRLYCGFAFFGAPATGRFTASIDFLSAGAGGSRGSFVYEWGFPASEMDTGSSPLTNVGRGGFPLPPYGVEKIEVGSESPWPSNTAGVRDELVMAAVDSGSFQELLFRMAPVPLVCECTRVRVHASIATTADASSQVTYGLWMPIGVRSCLQYPG